MLMKMIREGGVCNVDEMVMDSDELYLDFKTKMEAFFYTTRTFVSRKKIVDIYGMVNRARKNEIAIRIDVDYDNPVYSYPEHINGERLYIYQYEVSNERLMHLLLNCQDDGQANRLVKAILDTTEKLDDVITFFGWRPLESDTNESKRRRIVTNCVRYFGPTSWFQSFAQNYYKEAKAS